MRIDIRLHAPQRALVLPVHYNHLIQAAIYRHLDEALATWLHDEGFRFEKRLFKLFTFSRLYARNRRFDSERRELHLQGSVHLRIGTMHHDFMLSFIKHLMQNPKMRLGSQVCTVMDVEMERYTFPEGPAKVRALSPLTVYSTEEINGRKKTRFYTPFEEAFNRGIRDNLLRKARAFWGQTVELPPLSEVVIRPLKVEKRDQVIASYKGFWIKGWMGIYEINLPQPYFDLAYCAGLGAKNAQGFGMVKLCCSSHSN